jgi:hypothetical protein
MAGHRTKKSKQETGKLNLRTQEKNHATKEGENTNQIYLNLNKQYGRI